MNNVSLAGHLTRDPLLFEPSAPGGQPVCKLRLAADNGPGYDLVYIDVVSFGEAARAAAKYLRKGRAVEVVGRLQLREWEDAGGERRSAHEVVGNVRFLGGGRRGSGDGDDGGDGGGEADGVLEVGPEPALDVPAAGAGEPVAAA